jgi:hypothetical protein
LYRKIITGPQPICWLKFDDQIPDGGKLVDSASNSDFNFNIGGDTLNNVWPTSTIDSYCFNFRNVTNGKPTIIAAPGEHRFNIDGGSPDKPFSITSWINTSAGIDGTRIFTIYPVNSETNANIAFGINSRKCYLVLYDGTEGNREYILHNTVATYPLNTWVHLCCTYDGSANTTSIKLYADGVVQNTTPANSGYVRARASTAAARIGHNIVNGKMSAGPIKIDHFKFFDVELTAAEVLADYNLNKP